MSADFQQRRGVAWDIIEEALNSYDEFMLDDDYEPYDAMRKIFSKMKERRDLYQSSGDSALSPHTEK